MSRSLEGLVALDLTNGAAGAISSMLLAEHGARVVRILDEDALLHRDGGFRVWDRAKQCVRIPKHRLTADDPEFGELLKSSDILIEDFAPSDPRRGGIEWERIRAVNARLVSCSITAYGLSGPWRDEPPIDDLVLARAGILASMPGYRSPPVHVVHPLPSVGAGVMAALGVAAALLARETSGAGTMVSTSLLAGALLYHPKVTGEHLAAHTFQTHPAGSAPFYSVYQCGCGEWVQLGCVHPGFIARAAQLMGISELLEDPIYGKGQRPETAEAEEHLRAVLRDVIATRAYAEWAADFDTNDIPFAQARWTEDSLSDAQIAHNEMVVDLNDPVVGPLKQMGVAVKMSATPGKLDGPRVEAETQLRELKLTPSSGKSSAQNSVADKDSSPPPLDGIRVLEITNLIAGPTGGRLLADLGADVIKLEPLTGDMSRPIGRTYFYSVNFDKRSVSVNTSTDAGKQVVQRIADSVDMVLANMRPQALGRMGIGNAVDARLVETQLTGYGASGPYAHRPGIDPLAQALMGLERAQGGQFNPPVFPAQLAPTDFTNGALGAFGSVLALYVKARGGDGQRVDCNLLHSAILLTSPWFTEFEGREPRALADREQLGLNPFHSLYKLSDGWIYIAADDEQARQRLLASTPIKAPLVDEQEPPHPNESKLANALKEYFSSKKLVETLAQMKAADVPCAEVNAGDSAIFLDDEHALANDMVCVRQHPTVGELRVATRFIRFAGSHAAAGKPTPLLGEHVRPVLEEAGYAAEAIDELYASGVVKTETGGN